MLTKIILDVKIRAMKKDFQFFSISIKIMFFLILFYGCSLDYSSDTPEKIRAPEFTFEKLSLTKIDKGKKIAEIKADVLEQYHKLDASFAKNVHFILYNDKKLIEVDGDAELLSVDNKSQIYTMLNYVTITSYEQNINIEAKHLKWNNKTEQLTSSEEDIVTISNIDEDSKEGYVKAKSENDSKIFLQGKGFSASGVTRQYAFRESTSGKIVTQGEQNNSIGENTNEIQ